MYYYPHYNPNFYTVVRLITNWKLTRSRKPRVHAYDIPRSFHHHQPSTMESSFALTGKGYVIVAADMTTARSIVKMKVDEDKIKQLSSHLLMAFSGEPGKLCVYKPFCYLYIKVAFHQATPSSSQNTSSVTSDLRISETHMLYLPIRRLRGFAASLQTLCVRDRHTP